MIYDALVFLFYTNLSLLILHELDAIRRKEWRLFAFLKDMDDERAHQVFTLLHLPILVFIFWFLTHQAISTIFWFQIIIDTFLMIHLGLHLSIRNHENYQFSGKFSIRLIQSMALLGFIHVSIVALY